MALLHLNNCMLNVVCSALFIATYILQGVNKVLFIIYFELKVIWIIFPLVNIVQE